MAVKRVDRIVPTETSQQVMDETGKMCRGSRGASEADYSHVFTSTSHTRITHSHRLSLCLSVRLLLLHSHTVQHMLVTHCVVGAEHHQCEVCTLLYTENYYEAAQLLCFPDMYEIHYTNTKRTKVFTHPSESLSSGVPVTPTSTGV